MSHPLVCQCFFYEKRNNYKTNNLWVVGAIHSVWSFFQGVIFGIEVSGLSIFSLVFNSVPVTEKELLNGGAFGFEGGLTVTIVTLSAVIISLVLLNKKLQKGNPSESI